MYRNGDLIHSLLTLRSVWSTKYYTIYWLHISYTYIDYPKADLKWFVSFYINYCDYFVFEETATELFHGYSTKNSFNQAFLLSIVSLVSKLIRWIWYWYSPFVLPYEQNVNEKHSVETTLLFGRHLHLNVSFRFLMAVALRRNWGERTSYCFKY